MMVVLTGSGCGWHGQETPTWLVGVDLDLTGRGAALGPVYAAALELQRQRMEGRGGQARWELRVVDNRGDPAVSAANLDAFRADPRVAVVITAGCPQCLAMAAAPAEGRAVPVISLDPVAETTVATTSASTGVSAGVTPGVPPGSTPGSTPGATIPAAGGSRWLFALAPAAADNADLLSAAMAAAGVRTVGVLATSDRYGSAGLGWLRDAADRDGLRLVVARRLDPPGDPAALRAAAGTLASWTPVTSPAAVPPAVPPAAPPAVPPASELAPADPVAAVPAGTGPDAVVLWMPATQAAQAAAMLRRDGYEGRLFLDLIAGGELFPGEPALDGAVLVSTATAIADQRLAASPALAARQAWIRAYTSHTGTYHLRSSFAADALLVAVDALARAGDAGDREAVRRAVASSRLDGLTGQIRFSADQPSGLGTGALVLLTASGNRWR